LPGWLIGGNIAGLLANIGVLWSDYSSQRMLDDTAAGLLLPYKGKPDTPVQTKPPEVLPEIIVTASRADALKGALVLPPIPEFFPYEYRDVWDVPARVPAESPVAPAEIPLEIPPLRLPGRPPAPARRTKSPQRRRRKTEIENSPGMQIGNLFGSQIAGQTGANIATQPGVSVTPSTGVGSGLTGANPGLLGLPGLNTFPQAQLQPDQARQRKCKPCPKPKEKRRKKCYKKLVEERSYKRWDRVFEWEEIDCLTGRPL
jgi:hypothetical protein